MPKGRHGGLAASTRPRRLLAARTSLRPARRQRFGEPALAAALAHYRAALDTRRAELDAVEAELAPWASREPLEPAVARLGCYRGIAELTGVVLAAEVVDWRRTRRGSITKAGSEPVRTALVEAAWAYRFRPAIGLTLRRRQTDAAPDTLGRSWHAQRRLHARYKTMTARGKPAGVAITAMARELAGFVWAEMTS